MNNNSDTFKYLNKNINMPLNGEPNTQAERNFNDFIRSLSQLSAQLTDDSNIFDEEPYIEADENKLKFIKSKNNNANNFLENLLNQFSPETQIDKLIEIFQQFTQQDSLIEIWSHYLPNFFNESSRVINNFNDIQEIIMACYLNEEDYLFPDLLHSFTLLFKNNRLEKLIKNNINNFIWFLKIVHPDNMPQTLRAFSKEYLKNLFKEKNNILILKNNMDNEPDHSRESWNLILHTLNEIIQDNKIFIEIFNHFLKI